MKTTVKVIFPDGEREVEPEGWYQPPRNEPMRPKFRDDTRYRFEYCENGRIIALLKHVK